jgi:hypothetical protein
MNLEDIKEQLKKPEVYADRKSIYKWDPSKLGELPSFLSELAELHYVIVLSKNRMIL